MANEASRRSYTAKRNVTVVDAKDWGPRRRTRYKELDYQKQGRRNWRFIDNNTNHVVGASYASETELLSALPEYAKLFGCA